MHQEAEEERVGNGDTDKDLFFFREREEDWDKRRTHKTGSKTEESEWSMKLFTGQREVREIDDLWGTSRVVITRCSSYQRLDDILQYNDVVFLIHFILGCQHHECKMSTSRDNVFLEDGALVFKISPFRDKTSISSPYVYVIILQYCYLRL